MARWAACPHARPEGDFRRPGARYADTEEQAEGIRPTAYTATSPVPSRVPRSTWRPRSSTSSPRRAIRRRGGRHTTDPQRPRLPRRPRSPHPVPRERVFQALMKPTRAGLRFMGVAAQALLRTISRVAGADIVSDAVAFFQAFEGMEEGFRMRAGRVRELLRRARDRLRAGGLSPRRLGRRRPCTSPTSWAKRACRRARWWSTGYSPVSLTTSCLLGWRQWPALGLTKVARNRVRRAVPPCARRARGQPARLYGGVGSRGAGLRRPGRQSGPRPRLQGATARNRRPRPRRAGRRRDLFFDLVGRHRAAAGGRKIAPPPGR